MQTLRITLRQLQIFVAIAKSGSTVAACKAVALSQSATSAALNELEQTLGLRLFDRTGKRLLLNENGRALQPRAEALLSRALGIEQLASQIDGPFQALHIGASTSIGHYILPKLLASFLEQRHLTADSWKSKVIIGNTEEICRQVADFTLDIGLIEGPCHEPSLKTMPWIEDEMIVVASYQNEMLAERSSSQLRDIPLKKLQEAVWLLREQGSGTREITDQALLPYLNSYRRCIEMGSSTAIVHAVEANLGIACLSRWVVQDLLKRGRLREVKAKWPPIHRQCYWVIHQNKEMTRALERFIQMLSSITTKEGP